MNNIDRLITEQVHSWAVNDAKGTEYQDSPQSWPLITISREFGAGGRSLANALGKRIDFKVWDKELLNAVVEESGADERFIASLDERRRKAIDDILHSSFMGFKYSNTHYFRSLLRVIHTISAHGKSIIVGRGSHYIIKSPNALRVRIICPIEKRISYVAEREGISEKEALKLIKARDAERDDFIRHFFKQEPGNLYDYDVVFNSGTLTIEQLVNLSLLAYEQKTGKAIPLVAEYQ
jgi:cytidylate kinase